jgi:GNAT superfamily N-acetyltransferase
MGKTQRMGMDSAQLQVVELGRLSMRDWAQLVEGESEPFGGTCAGFEFRPKDHHVGLRDENGTLVAAGGWSRLDVEVDGYGRFEVIGLGALIVRHDRRGGGLATPIMQRIRDWTAETGVSRRLLLCEPHLIELYTRRGYLPIHDPVWVEQSSGPVRWPLCAMWRPTEPTVGWPTGVVRIQGPPF